MKLPTHFTEPCRCAHSVNSKMIQMDTYYARTAHLRKCFKSHTHAHRNIVYTLMRLDMLRVGQATI